MGEKIIIFDASTLITLAMNGMFEEIQGLKKIFGGKFIITKEVKKEIIDKPITINRFKLEALRLKQLLDDKILEMPVVLEVRDDEISKKTTEILDVANNTFQGDNKSIHLIDLGEASCLALSHMLNEKKIKNVIAMDERTTRMLGENPESLQKFLQKRLHAKISFKKENLKLFREFKVIRSSELVYIAYKKGLIKLKNGFILDALLYAVKFKGCAIAEDEIREIKKLDRKS